MVDSCAETGPPVLRRANPRAQERLRIDLRIMYALLIVFRKEEDARFARCLHDRSYVGGLSRGQRPDLEGL